MATKTQDQIKQEMAANSAAWHTADAATKKQLEAANQALGKQLGASFNSASGTWSDSSGNKLYDSGGSSSGSSSPSKTTGGTPSGFTGSATGVNTYTSDQDAIKAQMNANSQSWHTADDATKKQLEAQNKALAAQLGSGVTFDSASGTWNGEADRPVQTPAYQVNDYSNYLEEMYAAQRKAAIAKLNSAYQENLNAIDRAGTGLDAQYQNARNQAAGASELAARNFQEYAAAAGLNSGAGGQAELARNIALQNDLNTLYTQEAATLADLELQRVQAETEFNTAIAQAEAQGDYELAAALYEEKIRQNEAALQQQMLVYQQQRDAVADNQWQLNFDRQVSSNLADYGNAFLKQGIMPSSEMLNAMGMSSEDAQRYLDTLSLTAALRAVDEPVYDDPVPTWGSGYNTQINSGMKASEWAMVKNNIASNLRAGNYDNVDAYMGQVSGNMNKDQYNEIVDLLSRYGYTGLKKY